MVGVELVKDRTTKVRGWGIVRWPGEDLSINLLVHLFLLLLHVAVCHIVRLCMYALSYLVW